MRENQSSRREFIGQAVASVSVAALAGQVVAQTSSASATGLPTRVLGKTGARVSIVGVGGGHGQAMPDQAVYTRFAHTAVDEGITFFDNAWDYGMGVAEESMGKGLADGGYRKKVFLMTKNCGRDYKESMMCLEDSLRRLQTDHVDLWQHHEINYDNDPDWIFERGAMKAALEARQQGKVRFIGFTGHKDPHIQLNMLSKPFEWDTCMVPINVADFHFRSFQKNVVPVCLKRNIGVIGFKGLGGGSGMLVGKADLTVEECLRYSLSQPVSVQVVGMTSLEQLKQNIATARNFKPMDAAEQTKLLARVKEIAGDGRYEGFKTQLLYDGPYHRKQHGFPVE
jgi:predicted aldo/keto reductase-like oxidoreductase